VRSVTDIGEVDLESDVAQFVLCDGDPRVGNILRAQSVNFLHQRFDLIGWIEAKALAKASRVNELFQPCIPGLYSPQYKRLVCYRQFLLQEKSQWPQSL
jgi:hypothetical protein